MMAATLSTSNLDILRQRLENIRTSPARKAADDFFVETDWKTLPHRIQLLVDALQDNKQWEANDASVMMAFVEDPAQARRAALTGAIMASSPPDDDSFATSFESLFAASLARRDDRKHDKELNEIFRDEAQLFENLRILGWIESSSSLLFRQLVAAIQKTIYRKVRILISGDFDTAFYETVRDWKLFTVEPWLNDLLLDTWDESLSFFVDECYSLVRTEQIFDIVKAYPDSNTAVTELRDVLETTGTHNELAEFLRDSLIRRLNHPGADTSQIIDIYISTIKVLRILDPSDRLLSVVAEPVRVYLRGRSDTVRCIITSLTDAENGGDLYQELRRQDAKPLENVTVDSDDEEDPPDLDWQPPPSLNKPRGTFFPGGSRNAESDILAMLVSIYGSKELFVNEYRLMLAEKLLANLDYKTDKEIHTLELLKLRFGEISMNSAEIMIKDIEDSVRANKNIRDTLMKNVRPSSRKPGEEPVVDAAMISHIFWPTLQNEQVKHHPRIQAELDEFSDSYAELKNPRKLNWMNQLGTVQLELDVVEDNPEGAPHIETKEFSCSPLLATLISHFEDKETWTAEGLSDETGIPEHVIQKRMAYWISNRVVAFTSNDSSVEYTLTSLAERQLEHHPGVMDDHDDSGQAVSAAAQEEEEMEVYESYISVMLSSLQQAPLEKIHNMLKMLVSGSETKYNKTPQQLSAFLQRLCQQEKLECGPDGMYKLLKK